MTEPFWVNVYRSPETGRTFPGSSRWIDRELAEKATVLLRGGIESRPVYRIKVTPKPAATATGGA